MNPLMILKTAISTALMASACISSTALAGTAGGGGGDATEMGVDLIRDDILKWIDKGGAKAIKRWPEGVDYNAYVPAMKAILAPGAVVVSFVSTEQEARATDPEQKVIVNNQYKSCRGFWSKHDLKPHIICNKERYSVGGADQYRLIHHEFAGLAQIEKNIGAYSDYTISEQLTQFLKPEVVYRLSIMPQNQQPAAHPMAFVATVEQARVIRTEVVTQRSCEYVKFEKCALNNGQTYNRELNLFRADMTCSPLFKNIAGFSPEVLPALADFEQSRAYLKTAGGIGGGVAAAAIAVAAVGVAAGGGAAAGVAGVLVSVAGHSAYAIPTIVFTSGMTEKLLPDLRYVNPFFNGAVVKMLKVRDGKVISMMNVEGLIKQAPAIQGSLGDLSRLRNRKTGCPAVLRD